MTEIDLSPYFSHFQRMIMDGGVRMVPVFGPAMEPAIYDGEFVGINNAKAFECDAIYLLGRELIDAGIWRCQWTHRDRQGIVHCRQDNPIFRQELFLTRDEFAMECLGRVVALCGKADIPRGRSNWQMAEA